MKKSVNIGDSVRVSPFKLDSGEKLQSQSDLVADPMR